jgi:hypothetical protein
MPAFTSILMGAGTAASVAMNLSGAAKQAKAQSAAEQAAAEAAKKAEAEYQKEFLGGVQLPMEAYDQALRQGTAQQMQSVQALQEADARTLAAGVGKVQAQATEAQAATTNQMANDMYALQIAQAQEQGRNRDAIAKMNEQRAIGAGAAAADAEAARMRAYGGIGSAITSLGAMGLQAAPLYGKGGATPPDISKGFTINGSTAALSSGFNPANQSPVGDRVATPVAPVAPAFGPQNAYSIFEQYPGVISPQKNISSIVPGVTTTKKPSIQEYFQQLQYDYYNQ